MCRRSAALPFAGLLIAGFLTTACGSASETFVNPSSPSSTRCQPSLGSTSASYGPAGGAGSLTVAVERECEWTANPSASWIVVTAGKQGQGEGTVAYRVMENSDPLSRRGSIAIAGQNAQIVQDAAPCQFSVAPAELSVPSSGGDGSINVRTHSACSWTVSGGAAWATLAPASGKGDGTVQVHVVANSGGARTSDVIVAGQRVLLSQEGRGQTPPPPTPPDPGPNPPTPPSPPAPPTCSYDLSTHSGSFDAEGGVGGFRVRTSATCPWGVTSSASWVTIAGPSSGSGEGDIRFVVAPNFSPMGRSATLTIQSEVFRISQDRAEELKLDGRIATVSGVCPSLVFRVDNRTVLTDRETDFRKGDCSKAKTGERVTVRGFAQPDGTVKATRVEFD